MKRIIFVVVFMVSSLGEAALTQNQVKQVKTAVDQMQNTLAKMQRLAQATGEALAGGSVYSLSFSTVPYTLTSQQQQDIVNYYQNLKAQLQNQLDALP